MTPDEESIVKRIIEEHKRNKGVWDWGWNFDFNWENDGYLFQWNQLTAVGFTESEVAKFKMLHTILLEEGLVEYVNKRKTKLTRKGWLFISYEEDRKKEAADKALEESKKPWVQKNWLLTAICSFVFGSIVGPIAVETFKAKVLESDTKKQVLVDSSAKSPLQKKHA